MTWWTFIRRGHFAIRALNLRLKRAQEREAKRDEAILELSRVVKELATTPIAAPKPKEPGAIVARSMSHFNRLMSEQASDIEAAKGA